MNTLVCGAGALGSLYLDRLHAHDATNVAVVAEGERRTRLQRDGLTVNGRTFHPRVVSPSEATTSAGLIVIGVKHHQLAEALELVRPFVGKETLFLSLLNGILSERTLGETFGAEKVLPAFVLGTDAVREGNATRYSSPGKIHFGAPSNDPRDARVLRVKALFDQTGIPYEIPADILRAQWKKFMLNVGLNQVSGVLRAPYGAFLQISELRTLTRQAALEVVALSRHEGVALRPEDVDDIFPVLTHLAPGGRTSMLQDLEAGRKTEVELFAGVVGELGKRHGVPTPVNDLLGCALTALERMQSARTAVAAPDATS